MTSSFAGTGGIADAIVWGDVACSLALSGIWVLCVARFFLGMERERAAADEELLEESGRGCGGVW